jgi:hypothetical protein
MTAIFFPIIELVDRLAIAQIKLEKTGGNQAEYDYYQSQASKFDMSIILEDFINLVEIHKQIWSLESQLKSGKENELPLSEIGRRAIKIRNLNNRRIMLKNSMAEKFGDPVKEIKKDHLSE